MFVQLRLLLEKQQAVFQSLFRTLVMSFEILYTVFLELECFSSRSKKWPLRWITPGITSLVAVNLHSEAYKIDFQCLYFQYQNQYLQETFLDPNSRDHGRGKYLSAQMTPKLSNIIERSQYSITQE